MEDRVREDAGATVGFRFETGAGGGYVPILEDTSLDATSIAAQDAGSVNPGIFYQVGGGGLNGAFARALTRAGQLTGVNRSLVSAFEGRYGAGSWGPWNAGRAGGDPPLTSFLIPLEAGAPPIGAQVVGVMYSVGPVLGRGGIGDRDGYASIYRDAMAEIAAGGHTVDGLRITMLSTGIYAQLVADERELYRRAAGCIIDGIVGAVSADPELARVTVLINTSDQEPVDEGVGKERYGFAAAATKRRIAVTKTGFDVPVTPTGG